MAYTLLGGFVVAVSALDIFANYPRTANVFEVQCDILDDQGKGEILTDFVAPSFVNSHTQMYMNEVILGTGFGVILGPHVLDIFNPRSWTSITDTLTREIMRIVLATGLFAIGVELPKRYMAEHAKSLVIMVVPTMAFGWMVSAGKHAGVHMSPFLTLSMEVTIHFLFPKLDFVSSLVISACLTPTDPIISAAVIGEWVINPTIMHQS